MPETTHTNPQSHSDRQDACLTGDGKTEDGPAQQSKDLMGLPSPCQLTFSLGTS